MFTAVVECKNNRLTSAVFYFVICFNNMQLMLRIVLRFACSMIMFLALCPCRAQEPFSINYGISEGLPSTNIYSVFQQSNGIIWFTTDVGIVKYNSRSFELFNTDNGLSDNEVFNLVPDAKGRIWIQTLNGKPCFIYKGIIFNEKNSELLRQIKGSGMLIDIYTDDGNTVYLAFKNGNVFTVDSNDKVLKSDIYGISVSGVWKDQSAYLLTTEFTYNLNNPLDKIVNGNELFCRVYHSNQKTFISSRNLVLIPKKNQLQKLFELDKSFDITNVVEEGNNLWICTRTGLVLYENSVYKDTYFKDYLVSDILKDTEGNYWVTSLNKGVLFIPSFEVIQLLKDKKINSLGVKDERELWIGGFENDFYIKNKQGVIADHLNSAWPKNKISNIRFLGDTTVVVAKAGIEMRMNGKKATYVSSSNDLLLYNDNYFIATSYTSKLKKSDFTADAISSMYNKVILMRRSNVLCSDGSGNVWMGTNFGLFRYNEKDSVIDFGQRYEDLAISIEDLYYDAEASLLLVATASKGLVILKDNIFYKKINSRNGLNSNTINSIKKIERNTYLLGSNNGINKLHLPADTSNAEVYNYNAGFGIKNKRIKDVEVLGDSVYLATDNGLLYFNSSYLAQKNIKPACLITEVKTAFENNNTIHFKDNSISFSYVGISFIDRGDVEFFYKLDNQDREWTATHETQISYKSLSAGKYKFYVYCVNGFGNKSDIQETSFEILPPFWQQWWFRILMLTLIGLIFYAVVKLRLKQLRKSFEKERTTIQLERDKARLEKHMVELEQRALRMQMNPHFIFNALNTIKGYYAEGDFLNASNYISKFSKLLRKLLESEEQVTTLDNEIDMLKLYIELTQIRYEGKFDYAIIIPQNLPVEEILIPNLLLQPLVENAIIYGLGPKETKGFLNVDFAVQDGRLICTVEDNGIGRAAALENQKNKQHQSKATGIILERLALFDKQSSMEYQDKIENGIAAGTKVLISIPIKKISDDENIDY